MGCTDVAIKKARTAALFAAESGMLGKMSQPGLAWCSCIDSQGDGSNEAFFFSSTYKLISFEHNQSDPQLVPWR